MIETQAQPTRPRTQSAGQLRLGTDVDLRELTSVSASVVAYNLGYLTFTWGVAIAAITLFWVDPHWYTFLLAFLVVSSRQQALLNLEHEAVHRKFIPNLRLNNLLGTVLMAAPVGSPYQAAQARHLSHHRLLGSPEDPDHELHAGEAKHTRRGLTRHFVGALLGGYAGMVLMGPPTSAASPSKGSARGDLLAILVAQAAIAGACTLAFAWWVYPALWLVPLGTVTALCHLLRSFAEHAITDAENEGPHANRLITIRSNLIERELLSPFHMNYHAEHHLLPSVPAARLPELQERLTDHPDRPPVLTRRSYGSAVRDYVRQLPG